MAIGRAVWPKTRPPAIKAHGTAAPSPHRSGLRPGPPTRSTPRPCRRAVALVRADLRPPLFARWPPPSRPFNPPPARRPFRPASDQPAARAPALVALLRHRRRAIRCWSWSRRATPGSPRPRACPPSPPAASRRWRPTSQPSPGALPPGAPPRARDPTFCGGPSGRRFPRHRLIARLLGRALGDGAPTCFRWFQRHRCKMYQAPPHPHQEGFRRPQVGARIRRFPARPCGGRRPPATRATPDHPADRAEEPSDDRLSTT